MNTTNNQRTAAQVVDDLKFEQDKVQFLIAQRHKDALEIEELQIELAALRDQNARLLDVAKFFVHGYWTTVHIGEKLNQLKIHITDEQLEEFRGIVAKAMAIKESTP